MRRAFVGLSSPLGYDYANPATRAPADENSSPNPVLDSPFGLMLLFDEIIFLTRSLCPENMRSLPYVRFLDEEGRAPSLEGKDWKAVNALLENDPKWSQIANQLNNVRYKRDHDGTIKNAGVYWKGAVDNHTHGLKIGDLTVSGNSDIYQLVLDMLLLEDLADENMELVTSSFTQPYIESMSTLSPLAQSKLTELLTINNIHNYLTPAGPYHPAIEELRENSYLDHFRKWISTDHTNLSLPEIRDVKESVEQEIQRVQDEVFLKHLEPKGHYVSVGKAVVGDVLGLVIPGAGIAMSAFEEVVKFRGKKDTRWQGFVVSARSSARSKK